MQAKSVSHVDAIFGGRPVRFEIPRDVHALLDLENDLGSIRGCLGRFLDHTWRVSDVITVLARAHPAPPVQVEGMRPLVKVSETDAISKRIREARPDLVYPVGSTQGQAISPQPRPRRQIGINPALLDPILSKAPPTVYAILAARVLEALLYGIDPARARWDERNPTEEDAAPEGAAA